MMEFFIDMKIFERKMTLESTQLLKEMSKRNISWAVKAPAVKPTFMHRLSRNLGASTSWRCNRPVQKLLYFFFTQIHIYVA